MLTDGNNVDLNGKTKVCFVIILDYGLIIIKCVLHAICALVKASDSNCVLVADGNIVDVNRNRRAVVFYVV